MTNTIQCRNRVKKESKYLVDKVNAFADEHKEKISKKDGKKQFIDIMESAALAESIEELKLYIAYKGKKEGTRSMWAELAAPLNQELDSLREKAKKLAGERSGSSADQEQEDEFHLELVRRFAGYLMWKTHILISEMKKGGN